MRRWSGINLIPIALKVSSKTGSVIKLSGAVFLLFLLPSLGLCEYDLYIQINTGAVGWLGQPEISRYWNKGPIVGGEVGCYLWEYFCPSIGMSYTFVTLDWDQVERSDTSWAVGAASKRSYIMTGSFGLKLSDFREDNFVKMFISVGTSFLVQRTGRIDLVGWDGPVGIQCQNGGNCAPTQTEGIMLFDIGAGFGFGRIDGAILVVQSKVSVSPDLETIYLPLELGLRF